MHNKAALTRQCLDSILESPPATPFDIVVVDDASTDITPDLLAGYGKAVNPVRLDRNVGFATACNTGAAAGAAKLILFLNNDTIACPGWLDALIAYADEHQQATVVGSKLLYPDDTIQHAGVVFGISGDPLHLYAGCSAAHPAVNKSRRFQAVTAACLLIRRPAFEQVGGFDSGYHNDLEDVDLCLRLGRLGHEVHYCHESVLYHLESASRGRSSQPKGSARLYRKRWGADVRSDELDYYLEDGLLEVLRRSPDQVGLDSGRRRGEAELLQVRSRQFQDLLREVVRLSTYVGDPAAGDHAAAGTRDGNRNGRRRAPESARRIPGRLRRQIEGQMRGLRTQLAAAMGGQENQPPPAAEDVPPSRPQVHEPASRAGYSEVKARLPEITRDATPLGATVLVVSKGDEQLVRIDGRTGWHFPRAPDGRYAGFYPATGDDAVAHLEELREKGAEFLVFPSTAAWWLEYYPELSKHLEDRYRVAIQSDSCTVFDITGAGTFDGHGQAGGELVTAETSEQVAADGGARMAPDRYSGVVGRIRALVEDTLPPGATVLVVSRGDEDLVTFEGRRGWHFPRAEDGSYLGYHPANDADAIAHLEELREKGAEYLVLPSSAFWWLDHYKGFAELLYGRYSPLAQEDDTCLVFGLAERLAAEVVRNLLPAGSSIAIASRYEADVQGYPDHDAVMIAPDTDEAAALDTITGLADEGVRFLVIPQSEFGWLDHHPDLAEKLAARHVFVTRQEHACEIWQLCASARSGALAAAGAGTGGRREGGRGLLARLFSGRATEPDRRAQQHEDEDPDV